MQRSGLVGPREQQAGLGYGRLNVCVFAGDMEIQAEELRLSPVV